jgi:excisionase family DNA binding protein
MKAGDLIDKFDSLDRALTVAEVAELLAVRRETVFRRVKAGKLPSIRIRAGIRFDPNALVSSVADHGQQSSRGMSIHKS